MMTKARHLHYQNERILDSYERSWEPLPGEAELFSKYVTKDSRVLDIGVGPGRTVELLAPLAKTYLGVDFAPAMIERCKKRFPALDFEVVDASDLSRFASASFDVVVFSFNGLGELPDDATRERSFAEVARVLSPSGVYIFSLHNPRCLTYLPRYGGASPIRAVWRTAYAAYETARQARHRLASRAFWSGSGYVVEPGQHRLPTYVASRDAVEDAVSRVGMVVESFHGAEDEDRVALYTLPHFYYACRKVRDLRVRAARPKRRLS